MSNISGEEGSFSSGEEAHLHTSNNNISSITTSNGSSSQSQQQQNKQQPLAKKKRNLPGNPDPNAEVVALSPTTLMATNRFVCEICNKGFQRDQNLQLHRRGHNLPWKLRQRTTTEVRKRVYICPEPTCVHHNPARALGDLTGIKKHYSRKHGEKKWKCDKCSKKYAVQSDWKAHQKTCGTREYKCDCGTIFSRRDSFITHRAFCDALAEENNKVNQALMNNNMEHNMHSGQMHELMSSNAPLGLSEFNNFDPKINPLKSLPQELLPIPFKSMNNNMPPGGMFSTTSGNLFGTSQRSVASSSSGLQLSSNIPSNFSYLQDNGKNGVAQGQGQLPAPMSATALLQKAAQMGATASSSINSPMMQKSFVTSAMAGPDIAITRPIPNYENFQMQQDNNNHHHLQNQNQNQNHQSNLAAVMNDMGIYSGILMSNDQNNDGGYIKNVTEVLDHENHNNSTNDTPSHVIGIRNQTHVLGQNGSNDDMLTVDFLGVGGTTSRAPISNLQEQRRLEEAIDQQRMQAPVAINPFHHQQNINSQGNLGLEKPVWDV